MSVCEHIGHRVYTRRELPDGTVRHCVQCLNCLAIVKLPEHGNRPLIKLDEIPADKPIIPFIEPEATL